MKILKYILLLLLFTLTRNDTFSTLTCSPGFIQITTYCVQLASNTVGFIVNNNPCTSFNANGICITSSNTQTETSPTTISASSNTNNNYNYTGYAPYCANLVNEL